MKKIILVFISLLVLQKTNAQLSFASPANYTVGDLCKGITTADFNGDGYVDVVVTNSGSDNISVILGSNSGTFAAAVNYAVGDYPFGVTTNDFNGDGNVDIAVANNSSGDVSILLGSSSGTFASAINYAVGYGGFGITSSDFNSDGKIDLAIANSNNSSISVLIGTGTGSFSFPIDYAVSFGPLAVVAKDFNGDGKVDLATACNSGSVSIVLNLGTGTFGSSTNYSISAGTDPYSMVTADFNSDGKADLAIANYTSTISNSSISVLIGTGIGTFASAVNYTVGHSARTLCTADYNGDGNFDLATTSPYSSNLYILLGNGIGNFVSTFNYSSYGGPNTMVSDDFNGDGKVDFAGGYNSFSSIIRILLNTSTLTASSLNFDGVDDNVSLSNSATNQLNNGTIEAWVKIPLSGAGSGQRGVFVKEQAYGLFITNNRLGTYDWTSATTTTVGPVLNDNTWHHVALSFQNGVTNGSKFYLDGVAVGSPFTYSVNAQTNYPVIGGSAFGSQFLAGTIDDVRLWNGIRSQCQINTYKNCEIPTTASGLIVNYHFNQGLDASINTTVTTLTDASGSVNTGTLMNFALTTGTVSNWIAPGAIISGSITPSVLTPTVGSIVSNSVVCFGNTTTLTGTGVNTYTWTGGVMNAIAFTPTITSSYTVTGTSTLTGCSNTAIASVTVNSTPTITVNSGTICSGKSFTIVPSGASTYTCSSVSAIVSPLINTSYSVTGTSSLGCVGSNTAISSVTVNPTPTLSVTSGAICSGNNFTISPSGASTYTFSSGSAVVSPTISSTYSVTGTSSLGCVGSNTAVSSVTVNALPIISATNGTICSGTNFTIMPSGASTYTFSSGTALVSPTINSTYSVTGTSSLGCVGSNTAVSNVTVNASPIILANSGSICSGANFTITPSGASTYTFSSGSAVVSPTINSTYSITGTSSFGCVGSNTAVSSVTVNALPIISASNGTICSGTNFTITPSGASTYTFSSGTAVVNPTLNSTYSVTGTSSLGCVGSNTAISSVTVNPLPIISVSSGSICSSESYTINPSGALTYTISGGSAVVSPTISTTYTVAGTNINSCTNSQTLSVGVNTSCVWPGDANSDGIADNLDVLELGLHYTATGPARALLSNTYTPYDAANWVGTITSGKNLHHSDCNGDGTIDQNDTLAINLNYGLTHAFKQNNVSLNPEVYIVPDQASVYSGLWGSASIFLGDATTPINNINGVAFTVNFDNTLIETDSVWLEYPTSFLNATNTNLHFRKRDFTNSALYTATTHTDNINVTGNGKIATLHYKILASLTTTTTLNIGVSQANQSNTSGLITPLTVGSASLLAGGNAVGIKQNGNVATKVSIYPNPTNGILNIHISTPLNVTDNTEIKITNTLGQVVLQSSIINPKSSLNISDLANGIYFLQVYSAGKLVATQKIIKH